MRRLQQAFEDEEPALELAAVLQRAARYQAGEPPVSEEPPASGHGLTAVDLTAARRQDPAAVSRIYSAYAPALFRFFMAAVGDRHQAEDLTGTVFVSAIKGLAGFRGPVEALGGWLFQIARQNLDDHQRRQSRSRAEALEDDLDPAAAAAGAVGPPGAQQRHRHPDATGPASGPGPRGRVVGDAGSVVRGAGGHG